eukprot:TRINITY_DN8303_c0_g2_i1.p2 TRINITY_DN8303_c0_g2~~TRINITY_DN8303_c0_g2_i1.p2  ORF type:complete len:225 (+),score=65.28 TRINITY_DN8303_c0_g2_i1:1115-1789(+)
MKAQSNITQLDEYTLAEQQKANEKSSLAKKLEELSLQLKEIESVIGNKALAQLQINMNLNQLEIAEKLTNTRQRLEAAEEERQSLLLRLCGKKAIQEGLADFTSRYHQTLGEIKHSKSAIEQNERELNADQYVNIDKDIKYLSFQLLAVDKLVAAMERRHDAIEEGIMNYHSKKMEQTNKAIRDLWKLTYKGKDIDTIEIKSDLEKSSARSHSFNYRIVFKTSE